MPGKSAQPTRRLQIPLRFARETPSLEGKTLDLLSADAEYEVIGEEGDFAKISVDNDLVGYVYKDYITTQVDFKQAVSVARNSSRKLKKKN